MINLHHSMFNKPYNNTISIDNSEQEIFQTFMLALRVYFTHLLALLYLEVISNIQCLISQECTALLKNECQGIMPTTMSTSLVNINNILSDMYMDDIPA